MKHMKSLKIYVLSPYIPNTYSHISLYVLYIYSKLGNNPSGRFAGTSGMVQDNILYSNVSHGMVQDITLYQVARIKDRQCYEGALHESTPYEGALYELKGNKGFHKRGCVAKAARPLFVEAAEGRLLYFLPIHTGVPSYRVLSYRVPS